MQQAAAWETRPWPGGMRAAHAEISDRNIRWASVTELRSSELEEWVTVADFGIALSVPASEGPGSLGRASHSRGCHWGLAWTLWWR